MTSYTIPSGVTSTLTLHKGDTATVLSGGTLLSSTDAGSVLVSSGGIDSATTVLSGDVETLLSGAVGISDIVS